VTIAQPFGHEIYPESSRSPLTSQALAPWLPGIAARGTVFRRKIGPQNVWLLATAAQGLSLPRRLWAPARQTGSAELALQLPWLPAWPALTTKPIHCVSDFNWTRVLSQATAEIRAELRQVRASFRRARYDSKHNSKPWQTYYFYLHGRPIKEHLAACPRTSEILAEIPHNAFHVCFSAIEPGGALHPHTGPTNTSLTAHLGLLNCRGSTLHVADQAREFKDDEVLIFDDSFVHWVENRGDDIRYTLMITVWHPDLNAAERALLRRIAPGYADF